MGESIEFFTDSLIETLKEKFKNFNKIGKLKNIKKIDLDEYGFCHHYIYNNGDVFRKYNNAKVPSTENGKIRITNSNGNMVRIKVENLFIRAFDEEYFLDISLQTFPLKDEGYPHFKIASNGCVYDHRNTKRYVSAKSISLKSIDGGGFKTLKIGHLRKKYLDMSFENIPKDNKRNLHIIGRKDCWITSDGRIWDSLDVDGFLDKFKMRL